jgi:hypothetical protein
MDRKPQDLLSTGRLAELSQRHPGTITATARDLKLTACLRLNGVEYFDRTAAERILRRLRPADENNPRPGRSAQAESC